MNVDRFVLFTSMNKMLHDVLFTSMNKMLHEENISYEALKELHELISTLLNNYKLSLSNMVV